MFLFTFFCCYFIAQIALLGTVQTYSIESVSLLLKQSYSITKKIPFNRKRGCKIFTVFQTRTAKLQEVIQNVKKKKFNQRNSFLLKGMFSE